MTGDTITLPPILEGATLYRFTYEGRVDEYTYACDLRTTRAGYESHITISATLERIIAGVRTYALPLLAQTARALHETNNAKIHWSGERPANPGRISRAVRITTAHHECFSDLAGRIIDRLPKLNQATITLHYH